MMVDLKSDRQEARLKSKYFVTADSDEECDAVEGQSGSNSWPSKQDRCNTWHMDQDRVQQGRRAVLDGGGEWLQDLDTPSRPDGKFIYRAEQSVAPDLQPTVLKNMSLLDSPPDDDERMNLVI